MKLEVPERLMLMSLLPQEGEYITLKLTRKLREALSFSEKEIAAIDFLNHWKCPKCSTVELSAQVVKCPKCLIYMKPAGQVTWDEVKASSIVQDVHMGKSMQELCKITLVKLSDEKKLTEQFMSLYEKFVPPKEE